MKTRVIPVILTDGQTVVKGEKFNNWRTVGSAKAIARLFSHRNVDEIVFLDVTARNRRTCIDFELISEFSEILEVPFSVGGGVSSMQEFSQCIRAGAEKVVLGTSAIENPQLISDAAQEFGSQAVVVSVEAGLSAEDKTTIYSGSRISDLSTLEVVELVEEKGAGELLIQSPSRDGMMGGINLDLIAQVSGRTQLPLIASGGVGDLNDFLAVAKLGVSGVAAGAIFQFTEITPTSVRNFLRDSGIDVRTT
jgi:cyclase